MLKSQDVMPDNLAKKLLLAAATDPRAVVMVMMKENHEALVKAVEFYLSQRPILNLTGKQERFLRDFPNGR